MSTKPIRLNDYHEHWFIVELHCHIEVYSKNPLMLFAKQLNNVAHRNY